MPSKVIPSNPSDVMVIRQLTPNVTTLSTPFARFGLLSVGGRATLIRLTTGALAIFSPVALTPEVKATIDSLGGRLRYIIAPDMEHHIFVSAWKAAYPDALLIGPAGLPEKRAKQAASGTGTDLVNDDKFDVVFDPATKATTRVSEEFDADFVYELVDGHPSKEIVLLYKPDRVLIEADLLFNLPATEQYSRVPEAQRNFGSVLNRLFRSVQTTQGADLTWPKRFMWFVQSSANRESFNESIARIDAWDFETVVPCHGDTMVGDGKERFRKIMEWHLAAQKKSQ